jgi:hypothetical protein
VNFIFNQQPLKGKVKRVNEKGQLVIENEIEQSYNFGTLIWEI